MVIFHGYETNCQRIIHCFFFGVPIFTQVGGEFKDRSGKTACFGKATCRRQPELVGAIARSMRSCPQKRKPGMLPRCRRDNGTGDGNIEEMGKKILGIHLLLGQNLVCETIEKQSFCKNPWTLMFARIFRGSNWWGRTILIFGCSSPTYRKSLVG